MTLKEAEELKSFGCYCSCGGFAGTAMHGREEGVGFHLAYCPQVKIYMEWWAAVQTKTTKGGSPT